MPNGICWTNTPEKPILGLTNRMLTSLADLIFCELLSKLTKLSNDSELQLPINFLVRNPYILQKITYDRNCKKNNPNRK